MAKKKKGNSKKKKNVNSSNGTSQEAKAQQPLPPAEHDSVAPIASTDTDASALGNISHPVASEELGETIPATATAETEQVSNLHKAETLISSVEDLAVSSGKGDLKVVEAGYDVKNEIQENTIDQSEPKLDGPSDEKPIPVVGDVSEPSKDEEKIAASQEEEASEEKQAKEASQEDKDSPGKADAELKEEEQARLRKKAEATYAAELGKKMAEEEEKIRREAEAAHAVEMAMKLADEKERLRKEADEKERLRKEAEIVYAAELEKKMAEEQDRLAEEALAARISEDSHDKEGESPSKLAEAEKKIAEEHDKLAEEALSARISEDSLENDVGIIGQKTESEQGAPDLVKQDVDESPSDEFGTNVVEPASIANISTATLAPKAELASISTPPDSSMQSGFDDEKKSDAATPEALHDKETKDTPTLSFAQAFSSPPKKLTVETGSEQKESTEKATPRGLTFSQAFGGGPAVSPLTTPSSATKTTPVPFTTTLEPLKSTKSTGSSHSALSASKNKKVAGLVSKYVDEVAHEPLPGDSIPLHRKSLEASPSNSTSYSSQDTPLSAQSIREKIAVTETELAQLPTITSVRDKFETSAQGSGSGATFEFGESFRQKKRFEQLTDKEKELEAKAAMRGFNERDLFPGKSASGEIDTSNLGKVYTFEMSTNASMELPPDGICRVDYKKAHYSSMVFVVHRTRGMLLLHVNIGSDRSSQVPGGVVKESEFLKAAEKSGSASVQLQIAAREAAARQLYENTGLDIRMNVGRFKPAILRMNPPIDAEGVQYLKNEYDSKLFYFCQVDDEDFEAVLGENSKDASNSKLTRPSEDTGDDGLTLRLRKGFGGFTFVLDPGDAAKILKKDGNIDATAALSMIMNEASEGIRTNGPDAKATEYSVADSAPDDERADRASSTNVRTVGEKHADTNDHTDGVTCCCGWW